MSHGDEVPPVKTWTWRNFHQKLIGTTTGDKVIAWSVFIWSLVYSFGIMFCGVLLWNAISPWPAERWSVYFFITQIVAALIIGIISTVWFMVGGLVDIRALFRDLKARIANPLDDGRVEGHVSLADKAALGSDEDDE